MNLLIRPPADEDDLRALHLLRMYEANECAPVPADPVKVAQKIQTAFADPDRYTMLMAIADGRLAGHLCLEKVDYWYADAEFMTDFGFYVLPKYRNGNVGQALLEEATRRAVLADLPLTIFINNPKRPRGSRHRMEKIASLIRYVPAGAVLAFNSKGNESVLRQREPDQSQDD